MHLKNRLKKMEKQLNIGFQFCECRETSKYEIIHRQNGIDTIQNAVSEFCEQCCKPIEKQIIIVDFVRPKKPDRVTGEQYAAAYNE